MQYPSQHAFRSFPWTTIGISIVSILTTLTVLLFPSSTEEAWTGVYDEKKHLFKVMWLLEPDSTNHFRVLVSPISTSTTRIFLDFSNQLRVPLIATPSKSRNRCWVRVESVKKWVFTCIALEKTRDDWIIFDRIRLFFIGRCSLQISSVRCSSRKDRHP